MDIFISLLLPVRPAEIVMTTLSILTFTPTSSVTAYALWVSFESIRIEQLYSEWSKANYWARQNGNKNWNKDTNKIYFMTTFSWQVCLKLYLIAVQAKKGLLFLSFFFSIESLEFHIKGPINNFFYFYFLFLEIRPNHLGL